MLAIAIALLDFIQKGSILQHQIVEMRAPLRKAIVLVPKLRSKRSGDIKFAVVFEQWLPNYLRKLSRI